MIEHIAPQTRKKLGTTQLEHVALYTLEHAQKMFDGAPDASYHLTTATWRLLDGMVHAKLRELCAAVDADDEDWKPSLRN